MHAKIENNNIVEYPIMNLRQLLADLSLPNDLTVDANLPSGYVFINNNDVQSYDANTQKIVETTPIFLNEKWYRNYLIVELTDSEKTQIVNEKAENVRNERNTLLLASDWTQCKDIPDETSSKYISYRQALRDITEQGGFPFNVEWPVLSV